MSDVIGAVDRALDILIYLYQEGNEKGISEMSRDLGMHKSTIHRNLTTLEKKGFVYQNLENGKYWLGMKLFAIGKRVEDKLSFTKVVAPFTKELFQEFKEVVNVSILDTKGPNGPKSIIIHKEENESQVLTVNPKVGSSSDCHCSSVGKCLLAFGDNIPFDEYKEIELPKYTENTISTWDDLLDCLEDVKVNGYAIDEGELEIGLTCIGAPILDRNGVAVAAISLSGPTHRMHDGDFKYKIRKVKDIARMISNQL
ncbi:IclR family transcriptional regulator [Acidaminobacter sp. JC074]|uniref:IclR family transcriptional regulator n=1 Tax=Acidaminobacter sp. JC074 TaxID=2530199 RepID=UPI001F100DA4|nr:IclR family transcriptional regulator [Acidaminobacter sp. JC074]MCH4886429.1 IclR family transcriptional regulator [Acidaminobacter sp. JC074]